jgi:alkylresorcinol/alkylpyrone synthase
MRVRATRTRLFYDTLDLMGFRVEDTGFHMILDAAIPRMLEETIWPEVEVFLDDVGVGLAGVDHFLIHPGGRRILDAVEGRIGRGPEALAPSRTVLREYGNLSSASVLAVLHEHARTRTARPGEVGLLLAFGPSFSAEMILVEWTE